MGLNKGSENKVTVIQQDRSKEYVDAIKENEKEYEKNSTPKCHTVLFRESAYSSKPEESLDPGRVY